MACMLFLISGSYQPNAYAFLCSWNYAFRVRVLQVELVGPKTSVYVALIDVVGFTSLPFPAVHEHACSPSPAVYHEHTCSPSPTVREHACSLSPLVHEHVCSPSPAVYEHTCSPSPAVCKHLFPFPYRTWTYLFPFPISTWTHLFPLPNSTWTCLFTYIQPFEYIMPM